MSIQATPGVDAAMVLGMASTAIPFARSREAEAERWLRILRLHGEAGVALQSLGVSEAPLEAVNELGRQPASDGSEQQAQRDVVAVVSETALQAAEARGSHTVGTDDVLLAVMEFYGSDFNRVLHLHGTDRDEVLQRLHHAEAA
jgi:ATP-dependent Clp protease ATP-binding subunit ClpA